MARVVPHRDAAPVRRARRRARRCGEVAARFRQRADAYSDAVERTAWDGAWYRRAYFDDGTPLGSAQSDECQIDAIAQSWAVLSGAGDPDRARRAMQSVDERLVREDARLIMLLTPPFDKTTHDPGYIQGYLPGVRENGAQYTHAALWTALAAARLGDGDRAAQLFEMLNPLTHARTYDDVDTYKVEPYVVAADVYTAKGHLGRGGWTWYTGSASWMYRVALEGFSASRSAATGSRSNRACRAAWTEFSIEYRYGRDDLRHRGAQSERRDPRRRSRGGRWTDTFRTRAGAEALRRGPRCRNHRGYGVNRFALSRERAKPKTQPTCSPISRRMFRVGRVDVEYRDEIAGAIEHRHDDLRARARIAGDVSCEGADIESTT